MSENKCQFYPTDEELNIEGPFCRAGSDISGEYICTEEYSKRCEWAEEERRRITNDSRHNSSK